MNTYFHPSFVANYDVKAYGDEAEFSRYNFPSKGTTMKAPSGGWAIYSEPNFQGKVLYQIGSKFFAHEIKSLYLD